jgi:hypothetical protein
MALQRINAGRGHYYKIDGVKADGVTTLLGGGMPKPALPNWAAKSVAEHVADNLDAVLGMKDMGRDAIVNALKGIPWSKAREAAAKGTEVHAIAAELIHGRMVEVPDYIAGHVEGYVKFLDKYKVEPILVESVIGHRKWRYCGSLDMVARINGTVAIADIKTSGSGIYAETSYQLAAYRYAETYLDDSGAELKMADLGIERGFAIWCRADGTDLIPVRCDERRFKDFLHVMWVARCAWADKDNSPIGDIIHD